MFVEVKVLVEIDTTDLSGHCDLPNEILGKLRGEEGYSFTLSEFTEISEREFKNAPRVFDEFGGI